MLAKMAVKAPDEYIKKLESFGKDMPKIAAKMVIAAANPIADKIRLNLVENLYSQDYVGYGTGNAKNNRATGDLLDSFGVAKVTTDKNGVINTKIGFKDYDRKHVPNALKARAMESGTRWLKARPFVNPAVKSMKKKALSEMQKVLNAEYKIYAL